MNYKKNMPDIELLMEAWPPEVEEILDNVNSLTPELDIPLEDYARMVSEAMSASTLRFCQLLKLLTSNTQMAKVR